MLEQNWLTDDFDCVVMLTWSDWRTEPRSNRYHYATRFAKRLPVYFVQTTMPRPGAPVTEKVEGHDITIVHLGGYFGASQTSRFLEILGQRGHGKPIYWIYNPKFVDIWQRRPSSLNIYHATEDYFGKHEDQTYVDDALLRDLAATVQRVDLVVAVTDAVGENTRTGARYAGPLLILKNGCDAEHWIAAMAGAKRTDARTVIYQGGINFRLDLVMLEQIIREMPDWRFWFCGSAANAGQPQWSDICAKPNVRAFGQIHPDMIAKLQAHATVGIIPFQQSSLMQVSLPLKAYEYVASGLPVVTTPIAELEGSPDLFRTARTAGEFVTEIRASAATRWSTEHVERRLTAARSASYDRRFEELVGALERIHLDKKTKIETAGVVDERAEALHKSAPPQPPKKRVLVAYSGSGIHVQTTVDYLNSLKRYIDGEVEFVHVTNNARLNVDFSRYDAVFQNYCARWPYIGNISEDFAEALAGFAGPKLLAVQDEYDRTANLQDAIERVGFDVVLTCVPPDQVERVYPRSRFPNTDFIQILTGYVPEDLEQISEYALPLRQRPNVIGYRGRDIGPKYGRLAFDKLDIGRRMRAACEARGVPVDINWTEDSRIYGLDWFRFIGASRATLGTESGSNVFDFDESVERLYAELTEKKGSPVTYEEFLPLIRDKDESMDIGQISPKFFEAAALRTPMILLRGRYSDMLEPHEHYIPLEKDYSNIDDVLDALGDFDMLEAMANRTFDHIVGSGAFGYKTFVGKIDEIIDGKIAERRVRPRPPSPKPFTRKDEPAIAEEDLPLLVETATAIPQNTIAFRNKQLKLGSNRHLRHIKYLETVYPAEIARLVDTYSTEIKRITAAYEEQLGKMNAEMAQMQAALGRGRPVGR